MNHVFLVFDGSEAYNHAVILCLTQEIVGLLNVFIFCHSRNCFMWIRYVNLILMCGCPWKTNGLLLILQI